MAALQADAATEALIAQLMAEDFGEAYADQVRPLGSWYGDYEDPLTSYQRQCLENPNMPDGDGSWDPVSPVLSPAPSADPAPLPEWQMWDSGVNDDFWCESTSPADPVDQSTKSNGENESGSEKGEDRDMGGVTIEPLAHNYESTHTPIEPDTHQNVVFLEEFGSTHTSPILDTPDPFDDETTIDENDNHSPAEKEKRETTPSIITTNTPPLPDLKLPFHTRSTTPKPIPRDPSIPQNLSTNELLLDSNYDIDLSTAKNKGKAKAPITSTHSPHKHKRRNAKSSRGIDSESSEDSDDTQSIDSASGPRLLRVPWMGRRMGRGEKAFAEAMEKVVVEVRVGKEETLEGILRGSNLGA